jgi:general secretion pathway protein A
MDRVLLMGYLEEMHAFTEADINTVISDISEEFQLPEPQGDSLAMGAPAALGEDMRVGDMRVSDTRGGERRGNSVEVLDERMMRLEKSIVSVLSILKKIVATPQGAVTQPMDNQE